MATILAYNTPAMGHLFPMTALLSELRSRGHDIALRTLAAGVGMGRNLGFAAAKVDPRIEAIPLDDANAPSPAVGLRRAFDTFARHAEYEVTDLQKAIAEVRPDALIVDANCWGGAAAAEASGVPWASFWPFIPYLTSRGVPPFGPGLRPWPGVLGRARDALVRQKTIGVIDEAMVRPLNRIRGQLGLAHIASSDDFVRRAPLVLVATAQPFDYPHPDWDNSIQFIGPCSFDPAPPQPPEWLAAIDRPIVLVSTSSEWHGDTDLARMALAALADEPVHVVVTFPAGVPADVTPPDNATVCEFVPHSLVMDRAACVVTHGGMGTTQKALARGVPVCVVPRGRDQFEVARRVAVARCGTRLTADHLTPARLRKNVRRAMAMAAGARRVAAGYAATGGTAYGADLIEQRLLTPIVAQ
ncbi:nucleotide disphospho-sugar-binding domain-containing protein [Mycolicibacterium goodii]|uniref:nucleotide disphospho-sugar-binding domain-containing protein n=1 Tax=Mycolicibacterium goodii TaxID=134601 RepID=UPI000C2606F2|nr:nucleotide disphospho-sugar-binding domain-containing protein [Mycolicibacterium goodii]PJK23058.1 glycosyl transferase [Mycolicibacterium goodii]